MLGISAKERLIYATTTHVRMEVCAVSSRLVVGKIAWTFVYVPALLDFTGNFANLTDRLVRTTLAGMEARVSSKEEILCADALPERTESTVRLTIGWTVP
jgi:hypothetical protein